jgi:hypothetical protein
MAKSKNSTSRGRKARPGKPRRVSLGRALKLWGATIPQRLNNVEHEINGAKRLSILASRMAERARKDLGAVNVAPLSNPVTNAICDALGALQDMAALAESVYRHIVFAHGDVHDVRSLYGDVLRGRTA